MLRLIILFFLFTSTAVVATAGAAADDPNRISINCGEAAPATALNGRRWSGDAAAEGSSTASAVKGDLITAVDAVPYRTARVSRSRFSYSFRISPGQKFIRLHFNPVSYRGFESFNDLFTVEVGPFTLLANFSASITARALAVNTFTKEFCLMLQENQPLSMVFSPETSGSNYNYAFVNGIEIISVPSTISYCHGGDSGIHVLGQKSVIFVDNSTVLERVYHHNMKWGSVWDDIGGMFGIWASNLKKDANKNSNLSWRVPVDVGFRYLVRIHLYEVGLKMEFALLIDNMIALSSADMLQKGENQSTLWYNYMVMVEGRKREGKRSISISLIYQHEFLDRQGLLEGFEVFKLSNHDRSLANPNPLPLRGDSPSHTTQTLLFSLLGRRNAIATVFFSVICLVNIIVHFLQKMWVSDDPDVAEEENMPSARSKPLCRRFSLAEIQSATQNFDDGLVIGKGGFGKVYRGFIDDGRDIVAIKRSKPGSRDFQFWTEVETLSELRHVNLVSLIGYCMEQREMMIVYEYMPYGALADHLYKLSRESNKFYPLSWKQRVKICIGASRALDYLHTGHGIIHRDVKSSNILLDDKLVAKVSDFGLAKTGISSESESQDSTNLKGTFGYIDPEYFRTHKLTTKSDTYSFGVVLLEVLCGRRAVEPGKQEDERSLTMWAMNNISKGQVDRIVAPSLRGEISKDSLNTFLQVAVSCLHDELKKRPAMVHIVIKLQHALLQQERAESLSPKWRTSFEDVFRTVEKYEEKMDVLVSNEKINDSDALPQKENMRTSPNEEIKDVSDTMLYTDNDRTILATSPTPMATSSNVKRDTSLPRGQSNSTMINSGRKDGRKSMMYRVSQKLWPRDGFWKTWKPSDNTHMVGISVSAPISRRTSTVTRQGNTISNSVADVLPQKVNMRSSTNEEIRNVSDTLPYTDNKKSFLSTSPRPMATSSNVKTDTSLPRPQSNSTMINSGRKDGRKSLMHRVSRLWPRDGFWKTWKPSNKTDLVGISVSAPISRRTSTITTQGNTISNTRTDVISSTPTLRIFPFEELKASTRNFRSDLILGEGGFGRVYKGWIHEKSSAREGSGSIVAVKMLDLEGLQGFREWQSEVQFLGRLSHPNLVRLLGYGNDDRGGYDRGRLFLVYEFMQNGSLDNHLYRRSRPTLPWDIRLKILTGAARGLAFLHSLDVMVIYRDFKTSNILLDESYHAKISDFGLAKDGPMADRTHVSTRVMGTMGYAAPEYIATGHLTTKSDVYGFGVVLLEVLTGQRPYDNNRPSGQYNLVEWMKPRLSDRRKLNSIIDPRLEGRYSPAAAAKLGKLALNCLEADPRRRSTMQQVVESLGKMNTAAEKPRKSRVHFSP